MFFSKPHIIKSSDAELHLKNKKKRKGFPVTFAKKNLKQFVQSIFMSSRWELWRKERTRIHMGSLFCMFLIWTLVSGKFPVKVFVFQKKKKEWSRALFVLLPSFSIIQSFLFPNIHKKIYHFLSVKPFGYDKKFAVYNQIYTTGVEWTNLQEEGLVVGKVCLFPADFHKFHSNCKIPSCALKKQYKNDASYTRINGAKIR